MASYRVVVPARFGATRLPGKPLRAINGRPMLAHVWERVRDCGAQSVLLATDHDEIEAAAQSLGAEVARTRADHASGSERIAEVCDQRGWEGSDIVVNVQGDEPLLPKVLIGQVAELLAGDPDADCASLYVAIESATELADPNVVKVVLDARGRALYFSRSALPYDRESSGYNPEQPYYRHIGIYAYRVSALRWFVSTPASDLEQRERLEQLRFLSHGRVVVMAEAQQRPGPGVDTEADLEKVAAILAAGDPSYE